MVLWVECKQKMKSPAIKPGLSTACVVATFAVLSRCEPDRISISLFTSPVNLARDLRRNMRNNKPGYKPQNGVVGPVRNHGGARNMWISPPSIRNGTYPSGLFGVSVPVINIQPPSGGRSGNDKPVSLPVFFVR